MNLIKQIKAAINISSLYSLIVLKNTINGPVGRCFLAWHKECLLTESSCVGVSPKKLPRGQPQGNIWFTWVQPQLRPVVSSEQLPQPQSPTMAVQTLLLLLLILVMGALSSSGKLAMGILENFCVWKTTLVPFWLILAVVNLFARLLKVVGSRSELLENLLS